MCVRTIAYYFGRKMKISSTVRFCKKCRYKKVVNKDGSVQITSVPVKVLRYLPLKPRLQWLYLSQKTAKHMSIKREFVIIQDA
jgi:hypothetical protein